MLFSQVYLKQNLYLAYFQNGGRLKFVKLNISKAVNLMKNVQD